MFWGTTTIISPFSEHTRLFLRALPFQLHVLSRTMSGKVSSRCQKKQKSWMRDAGCRKEGAGFGPGSENAFSPLFPLPVSPLIHEETTKQTQGWMRLGFVNVLGFGFFFFSRHSLPPPPASLSSLHPSPKNSANFHECKNNQNLALCLITLYLITSTGSDKGRIQCSCLVQCCLI